MHAAPRPPISTVMFAPTNPDMSDNLAWIKHERVPRAPASSVEPVYSVTACTPDTRRAQVVKMCGPKDVWTKR